MVKLLDIASGHGNIRLLNPMENSELPIPKLMQEITQQKICNTCPCFSKEETKFAPKYVCSNNNLRDWYGTPTSKRRNIKAVLDMDGNIVSPQWCPLAAQVENNKSMLSEEQQKKWNESKSNWEMANKWKMLDGLTKWEDIEEGVAYHVPPSVQGQRMDIVVDNVYPVSLRGHLLGTNTVKWMYKVDGDHKFMYKI